VTLLFGAIANNPFFSTSLRLATLSLFLQGSKTALNAKPLSNLQPGASPRPGGCVLAWI